MVSITYRQLTVDEFLSARNLNELIEAYADESAINGMPPFKMHNEAYRALEKSGATMAFGAFDENDTIVGFIQIITHVLPHYSVQVSATESYFVLAEHRKQGAGIRLLRLAEEYARERGSYALLVSAPTGGRLDALLPNLGYAETNRVFFRKLCQ